MIELLEDLEGMLEFWDFLDSWIWILILDLWFTLIWFQIVLILDNEQVDPKMLDVYLCDRLVHKMIILLSVGRRIHLPTPRKQDDNLTKYMKKDVST